MIPGQARASGRRRGHHEVELDQAAGLLGQGVHEGGVVLLALPVGLELLVDDRHVLFRQDDAIVGLAGPDLFREEALFQLRIQHGVATRRAGAADDELILLDVDGGVAQHVRHGLAPPQDQGLALGLPERFGDQAGPLQIQSDGLVPEALEHSVDPGPSPLRVFVDEPDPLPVLDSLFLR